MSRLKSKVGRVEQFHWLSRPFAHLELGQAKATSVYVLKNIIEVTFTLSRHWYLQFAVAVFHFQYFHAD